MEVRLLHSLEAVAPLSRQLERVNLASRSPSPFATFPFLDNFVRNDEFYPGGEGMEVWFLTAQEGDEVIGYLPLRRIRVGPPGLRWAKLEFLATHDTDRQGLVARAADEARVARAFCRFLLECGREWSLLEFTHQDQASPLGAACRELPPERHVVRYFAAPPSCSLRLPWRGIRQYHAALSRNSRKALRRGLKRLLGAGEVEVLWSDDPACLPGLLALYLELEHHSWKGAAGGTIGRDPRRIAFVKGLMAPSQPMALRIQLLLLDDAPIAGLVLGRYHGGRYALQSAYDERARELSPALALQLVTINGAINEQLGFYNLLMGFAYYKSRLLAETIETRTVQVFRRGSGYYWKAQLGDLRRRLWGANEEVDFNPAHREIVEREDLAHRGGWPAPPPPGVRALVERLREGPVQRIEAGALAELAPVEVAERRDVAASVQVR